MDSSQQETRLKAPIFGGFATLKPVFKFIDLRAAAVSSPDPEIKGCALLAAEIMKLAIHDAAVVVAWNPQGFDPEAMVLNYKERSFEDAESASPIIDTISVFAQLLDLNIDQLETYLSLKFAQIASDQIADPRTHLVEIPALPRLKRANRHLAKIKDLLILVEKGRHAGQISMSLPRHRRIRDRPISNPHIAAQAALVTHQQLMLAV